MRRLAIEPRADWRREVEQQGLVYHSTGGPYWDESVCYVFTTAEIDAIEAATNELHRISLQAVQHILDRDLLERFGISEVGKTLIRASWDREDFFLYGRFDLFFDGSCPPKLYEYNADTPTALLEAAVIQWQWLEQRFPNADQFNSIHERLIIRWQERDSSLPIYFACADGSDEDFANTVYLEDTAIQAGLKTHRLFINEIGWDGTRFVDLQQRPIESLFKLYPWEWLLSEEFGRHLSHQPRQIIEPAWKILLSHKAILPVLWELFPHHPNLLPAYTHSEPLGTRFAKKPVLGREGANITLQADGQTFDTAGDYNHGSYIYQALQLPARLDGRFAVIGSWVIGDEAAGIGIRESDSPISQNTSRFVPHYFGD